MYSVFGCKRCTTGTPRDRRIIFFPLLNYTECAILLIISVQADAENLPGLRINALHGTAYPEGFFYGSVSVTVFRPGLSLILGF